MKKLYLPLLTCSLFLTACPGTPTPEADTVAPQVTLTATAPTVPGQVTLFATATDPGGVTKVEFYQGSALIDTDSEAPYSTDKFAVDQRNNGSVTFTVKAFDSAGNIGMTATTVAVNVTSLYQGQYYWFMFSNPNDIEGSVIAEGMAIYGDQFINGRGKLMASGMYAKISPVPELEGDASLGPVEDAGKTYLSTLFFHDSAGTPLYFWGDDFDGAFSDLGGDPGLVGEASLFKTDGTVAAEGYYGMVRLTSDPYASLTASGITTQALSPAERQKVLSSAALPLSLKAQGTPRVRSAARLAQQLRR
ncbi:Ig-like domain-containing protein [Deinococcus malanensis]|uniref:Ig-like domain-containing protein n=1 Tax=Deinococcus malanensis TaxID=1706855 RepID=UPI00166C8DD5|nr:Ig-like domain-containing protein [Deinococcus malanensis]